MVRVSAVVFAAILARSLTAAADPSSTAPVNPDNGVADYVGNDAAAGRAYLSPTAFTSPAGTAGISSWFPGLPVVGVVAGTYAITDRIEIGAGATFDTPDHDYAVNYLEARFQVLRGRHGAIALEWQRMSDPGDGNDAIDAFTVVGSHVMGRTVVSASLTGIPTDGALHLFGDASIVSGGRFKLVGEGLLVGDRDSHTLIVYGGGRYASARFSADLGFAIADDGDRTEPAPFPFAAIAARL